MISVNNELLRSVMKTLCYSKALTQQDIASKFKLSPTEAETLLSVLVGEGLLTRVEAGTTCLCAGCPFRVVCGIKTSNKGNITTITYYKLSSYGLKICEELKT